MFLQIMFLICSVFNTYGVASTASQWCRADEYRAGQVCCLACPGGYRVHRDCTATTITLCSKCPDDTFKEGFSGQKQCSACTKCGTVLGLKVKKSCTPTSDAECEVRDGFFCSDSADKDTFSDATSSCQPHTICDSGVQIKPGTDSTDSTCITYVAIVFIIIGCICFIILLFLGALVFRRHQKKKKKEKEKLELDRELDELANLLPVMETLEQAMECDESIYRLLMKKKTTEQERKLKVLHALLREKKEKLELDRELTELANLIHEMETLDQLKKCCDMYYRLQKKKKTPEQERKLKGLADQYNEKKERLELDRELTELANLIREAETTDQCMKCNNMYYRLLEKKKTPEQEEKLYELADQYNKKTEKLKLDWRSTGWFGRRKNKTQEPNMELNGGAAGEGTSGPSSTPHPSLEPSAGLETFSPPAPSSETQPAGLETSSPPAPSSETQPAAELAKQSLQEETPKRWWEPAGWFDRLLGKKKTQEPNMELNETTPLTSSDSPAPTGDQQEHTSRTTIPDVTMDGHDDDQRLDAFRSGTGQ